MLASTYLNWPVLFSVLNMVDWLQLYGNSVAIDMVFFDLHIMKILAHWFLLEVAGPLCPYPIFFLQNQTASIGVMNGECWGKVTLNW